MDENLLPVGRALDEVSTALYPGHPDIPELPSRASSRKWSALSQARARDPGLRSGAVALIPVSASRG